MPKHLINDLTKWHGMLMSTMFIRVACFRKIIARKKGENINASSLIQIKVRNNKMKINGAEITFNLN